MKKEPHASGGSLIVPENEFEDVILGGYLRRLVIEEAGDETTMTSGTIASVEHEGEGVYRIRDNDTSEYWGLDGELMPKKLPED